MSPITSSNDPLRSYCLVLTKGGNRIVFGWLRRLQSYNQNRSRLTACCTGFIVDRRFPCSTCVNTSTLPTALVVRICVLISSLAPLASNPTVHQTVPEFFDPHRKCHARNHALSSIEGFYVKYHALSPIEVHRAENHALLPSVDHHEPLTFAHNVEFCTLRCLRNHGCSSSWFRSE